MNKNELFDLKMDHIVSTQKYTTKRAKWAELAVQFSWYLQNGPQHFNFFSSMGAKPSF